METFTELALFLPERKNSTPVVRFEGVFTIRAPQQMHQTGQLSDGGAGRLRRLVNPRPVSTATAATWGKKGEKRKESRLSFFHVPSRCPLSPTQTLRWSVASDRAVCLECFDESRGGEIVKSHDQSVEITLVLLQSAGSIKKHF